MSSTQRYPSEALTLAKALTLQPELWERPQVQGITIDGPDSRDLDDAIWIEPISTGAILSVHIADVSELVTPGSILEKVAIARTATQYLKSSNDPMLPRALSEDKLSLLEHQDRPTLTVRVTLDAKGDIEHTEIFESWLRSSKRFSYREAEAVQKDPQAPFSTLLQTAYRWAELLYRNRLKSGAIGATLTAQGDWLTEEGSLVQGQQHSSHLLIQEFMILANSAVAEWLAERDVPMLYRNHTAKAIAPERETMYQEMLLLRSGADVRKRMASWLNRAEYGPSLIGHFALNLPAYTHFTSPIRRLADLINHRIVKALLRGQKTPYSKVELEQLGQHITNVTREKEEETNEYFKAEHRKVIESQIETPEELEQLSPKEFTRILKYAIEQDEIEPVMTELTTRLNTEKLQVQELYLLVFRNSEKEPQQRVFEYLSTHIQDAASVVAIASNQEEDWDGLDYVEHDDSSPFHIWLEVKITGESLTTVHAATHQRKQPARHLACLNWIEAYLQDALVTPEQRVQPQAPEPVQTLPSVEPAKQIQAKPLHEALAKPLKDGQNFVGMLNSLCQILRWELPEYEFTDADPGFECECRLLAQDALVQGSGISTKKQRAKMLAAWRVLEQLQAEARVKWGEWSA